jgi:hypothetical protein
MSENQPTMKKQKISKPTWDRESDEHQELIDMFVTKKVSAKVAIRDLLSLRPSWKDYEDKLFRSALKDVRKEASKFHTQKRKEESNGPNPTVDNLRSK